LKRLSLFRRPAIGSVTLSILVVVYILILLNLSFWNNAFYVFGGFSANFYRFTAALILMIFAGTIVFSVKFVIKPFLVCLVIVAAVSSYFTDTFGVVIDKEMIRNAAVSTPQESGHLITLRFVMHVVIYGILPSLLIILTRVHHLPFLQKFFVNMSIIVPCLGTSLGLIVFSFASISSNLREHRDMMAKLTPFGPMTSAISLSVSAYQSYGIVRAPLGRDAKLGPVLQQSAKPVVTVVLVGETARAMNFSLNGYSRETNPEMKARGVVNFPNTTSCGTATAVSLPCMFSVYTRQQYSDRKARSTDTLMDVLRNAGIDCHWWDNNTGSKGIADFISFIDVTKKTDPLCQNGECQDDIFLGDLDRQLDRVRKDTVIVLHQSGSHGPAYYLRYPDAYRRFQPDCRTAQLSDCTQDEIVNAYDNTILYTDHNVASVIDILKKHAPALDTAMIYMSDHGESLGENGLFLHGAPYSVAPKEQTQVPFTAWFSDAYAALTNLDIACLRKTAIKPVSHDDLFHTLLGMMNVVTSVYDPQLDAFAQCRALHAASATL